ncbi:hypothetical protein FB451DRAFT_1167728 [Mycena latifolia]|nr:hypothetical protein FB451DRAFT_1167728 [Mycena latifolia]
MPLVGEPGSNRLQWDVDPSTGCTNNPHLHLLGQREAEKSAKLTCKARSIGDSTWSMMEGSLVLSISTSTKWVKSNGQEGEMNQFASRMHLSEARGRDEVGAGLTLQKATRIEPISTGEFPSIKFDVAKYVWLGGNTQRAADEGGGYGITCRLARDPRARYGGEPRTLGGRDSRQSGRKALGSIRDIAAEMALDSVTRTRGGNSQDVQIQLLQKLDKESQALNSSQYSTPMPSTRSSTASPRRKRVTPEDTADLFPRVTRRTTAAGTTFLVTPVAPDPLRPARSTIGHSPNSRALQEVFDTHPDADDTESGPRSDRLIPCLRDMYPPDNVLLGRTDQRRTPPTQQPSLASIAAISPIQKCLSIQLPPRSDETARNVNLNKPANWTSRIEGKTYIVRRRSSMAGIY